MATITTTTPIETAPSWVPTRKWIANAVVGVIGVLILTVQQGSVTKEAAIAALTLCAQLVSSYLLPNDPAPGGVPRKPVS
jgi:hypothetical protein